MKLACLAAATALLASTAAHADTPEGGKDENTALLLSLGGTAASVALVVAGANSEGSNGDSLVTIGLLSSLVTPSFGHWYAGDYFTAGMGMRAGGGLLAIVGLGQALGCAFAEESDSSCNGDSGAAFMLLGVGLYAGGTIYDIATAPSAARRWNEHHLQLSPMMVSSGAHSGMGVGLGGTF